MDLPGEFGIFPKVRKAYTISKSREKWSDVEHDKFLEALQLFNRDWKKIEAFVATKYAIQIRSHVQKYFLKVEKNGSNEHVPRPRPKRKAVHPYPQKASKIACAIIQSDGQPHNFSAPVFPSTVFANQSETKPSTSWIFGSPPAVNPSNKNIDEVASDFAQAYSFIGSVFDPNGIDHLQMLKSMDPTNLETILFLMRNLSVNLVSPEFEEHMKVLSSYEDQV